MRRNFLRSLIICLIPTALAALFVGWASYEETDAAKQAAERRSDDRENAQQRLDAAVAKVNRLKQEESDAGSKGLSDEKKEQLKQAVAEEKAEREAVAAAAEGWHPHFRRGIDLAGGTILIYEVKSGDLETEQIKQLAEKLKKRIDENDLKNVVVRPLGKNRIEIILPFAGGGGKKGANAEFVEDVRSKVKQTGVLEFRILANGNDDARGIEEATKLIEDPANADKLREAAEQGVPPPAPVGSFEVKAAGETPEQVFYEWVELGKEERESMGLSQQYQGVGKTFTRNGQTHTSHFFDDLARSRDKVYPPGGRTGDGPLYFSRVFAKKGRSRDEADKTVEYFVLTRVSPADSLRVVGDVRISATYHPTSSGNKGPAVGFTFTSGGNRFYELTKRNKPSGFERQLAIIMDGKIVSAPTLHDALNGGGEISGNFDAKSANQLISILKSGNLNAELKPDPVSENTVGATLGETTIKNGLIAVVASFLAVLLFMVVYYRFAGFVACVALFVNLLMTVGFMVAMNAAFTLPGLAGVVLMLGMAVDANVLIYERIREEREKGATLAAAIRNGYDRAFATIIDTHLTSIFTAVVLYMFGNDALKGFSVSLTVGLIISLFTSLYITRLMFDFWLYKKWLTQLKMLKLFARPNFNFMKIRHAMFLATSVSTVIGLALFLARGERVLNVDFTQGTAYGGRLAEGQERTQSELYALLNEDAQKKRLAGAVVQPVEGVENVYEVTYGDGEQTRLTLANRPEGATDAERKANLTARLSGLPDVSLEQVFLQDDKFAAGKSRSFTVRTTEKEKEVVQVVLDRLLREDEKDGKRRPLLSTDLAKRPFTFAKTGDKEDPVVRVEFTKADGSGFDAKKKGEGVSPAYFRDFVVRELRANPATAADADKVKVTGVPTTPPENATDEQKGAAAAEAAAELQAQRYKVLSVDFTDVAEVKARFLDPARTAEGRNFLTDGQGGVLDRAVKTFESRPVPERLETFDPSVAKDTRNSALWAILVSWLAILAYLWFRFRSWQFGLAAVLCLIHDLCFTLGCIAACHYLHDTAFGHALGLQDFKLDLAAVAALLTLVGYSVNDTIVVFDRIREVRGKNPHLTPGMINDSVNQTLSRTILAALTVFLVVVVLYIWGGEGVHLFAFVMVMGVIVGTYSSIYIASPLLLIFGEGKAKAGLPGGPGGGPGGEDRPAEAAPVSAIAS